MKQLKTFAYGFLAGFIIAIGGTVFLSLDNKVLGSVFFTIGLFCVLTFGFNLFTGKVCYVFDNKPSYIADLIYIWLGNFAGTWFVAFIEKFTRIYPAINAKAVALCETKLNDTPVSIFILAALCNVLIFVAVDVYKNHPHGGGKYIAMFFGVTVFILCGFEHCVANMYYFSIAGVWSLRAFVYLIVMTFGNSVGGVMIPLIRKFKEKSENDTSHHHSHREK